MSTSGQRHSNCPQINIKFFIFNEIIAMIAINKSYCSY